MTNHYEVLGVSPDAPKDAIKAAYRERVEQANERGDADTARELNAAWNVLSDPYQRGRYDEAIANPHAEAGTEAHGDGDGEDSGERDGERAPLVPGGSSREAPKGLMGRLLGPPPQRDAKGRVVAPDLGLPGGLVPAPNGRRMLGVIIDGFGFFAIFQFAGWLGLQAAGSKPSAVKNAPPVPVNYGVYLVVTIAIFVAVYLLFEVIPTHRRGQTVGRRLARVRVVDRTTGALPSWRQSFVRALVPLVVFLVAIVFLASAAPILVLGVVLWSAVDPGRQGLHDKVAKTIAVDVPRAPKSSSSSATSGVSTRESRRATPARKSSRPAPKAGQRPGAKN